MYNIELPREMIEALWCLREQYGCGSIIGQVKEAVYRYLNEEEERLGHPIKESSDNEVEDSR